jgi:hypothetical protein
MGVFVISEQQQSKTNIYVLPCFFFFSTALWSQICRLDLGQRGLNLKPIFWWRVMAAI